MRANGKKLDNTVIAFKLELIDRLENYDIKVNDLYAYEDELRAIADMPPQRRKIQFNNLVSRIRSNCKKKARGGKISNE